MTNLKEHNHLFINLCFLEINSLKNIKNVFTQIHKKFISIIDTCDNHAQVMQKLISNADNNFLFYTGLETKWDQKLEKRMPDVEQTLRKIGFDTITKKKVKTCLNGDKSKRLLSILIIINIEKIIGQKEKVFILFPIEYLDTHK